MGLYVSRIHQIDFTGNRYSFEGFLWFNWQTNLWDAMAASAGLQGDLAKGPYKTAEILGVVEEQDRVVVIEKPGYACLKIKGQVANPWDVRRFPFDRQRIELSIEDASFESDKVLYLIDSANSGLDADVRVPGWTLGKLVGDVFDHRSESTFGDPDLKSVGAMPYHRVNFSVEIRREGWAYGLKIFLGLVVSVGIGFCALMIRPVDVDPRFGLGVGALFGAVSSEYLVSASLPDTGRFSLADSVHCLSLVIVLSQIAVSTYSLRLWQSDDLCGPDLSRAWDRRWIVRLLVLEIGAAAILVTFFMS